jgi:hypothetical protein
VKAGASENYSEDTGPSMITEYTDSASFTFNTLRLGNEFTGTITEKQVYRRNGQTVATCLETYRLSGYLNPRPDVAEKEFSLIDEISGWLRDALVDPDASKNTDKRKYSSWGVRG